MKPRLVRDRMAVPVVVGNEAMSLTDLLALLSKRAISAVPIVRGAELVGVVSTTDLMAAKLGERSCEDAAPSRAGEVMSTPVVTIRSQDTLAKAARKLAAAKVHRLVVVDRGRVVGVLSAHEALEEVRAHRIALPLRDVMSAPVVTVDVDATIEDASRALARANVHGVIVVDDEMPVGVFTHAEALAALDLPPLLRQRPVEEVMSYETICLNAKTPVYRAAGYVSAMDVRRLIVVEQRKIVGIASALDLLDVLPRAFDPSMLETR